MILTVSVYLINSEEQDLKKRRSKNDKLNGRNICLCIEFAKIEARIVLELVTMRLVLNH